MSMSRVDTVRHHLIKKAEQERFTEITDLVRCISSLSGISEKIASAEASSFTQDVTAISADMLYDVMYKEALLVDTKEPPHRKMVQYIDKLAATLKKEKVPAAIAHKIAAVVATDDTLSCVIGNGTQKTATDYRDLYRMRGFGREFFVDLLQGTLK